MDWDNLGFKYRKTNSVLSSLYSDGKWGEVKSQDEDQLKITVCSPSFHYGMACFEGLKAFRGADGKVRIFRPDENAQRIVNSCNFLGLPAPDKKLFIDMCVRAVKENIDFLPPYGHKASLYIRPVIVTTIPSVNLVPQNEGILFMVFCFPVGTYSGGKVLQPIKTIVARDFDRAAPFGSGQVKVCGNYAGAMYAEAAAVKMGYGDVLFLDPATKTYVDEFSSANFIGIRGNEYVTPLSDTILPSITNKSLCQVATDLGMTVNRCKFTLDELETFEEVGQCGTAAVITPISCVDDKPSLKSPEIIKSYQYENAGGEGSALRKLYTTLTGIQFGELPDTHGWCLMVEE